MPTPPPAPGLPPASDSPPAPGPPPVPNPAEHELSEAPGVKGKVKGKGKRKGKATTIDKVGMNVEANDSSSAVSKARRTRSGNTKGQAQAMIPTF